LRHERSFHKPSFRELAGLTHLPRRQAAAVRGSNVMEDRQATDKVLAKTLSVSELTPFATKAYQ
jgi:hypothetical protein